jgi:V/A-type H+-transporting ATPase subunit I
MLLKMAHIQIIGTRAQLDATVASLHRLGVLHIQDGPRSSTLKSMALDDTSLRLQEDLAFLAARLDALIRLLPDPEEHLHGTDSHSPWIARELVAQIRGELDHIAPEIQELAQRRDELQAEALSLPRYLASLRKLAPLTVEQRTLQGFDTVALLIHKHHRDVLDLLRVEIEQATHAQYEIVAQDVDEQTIAALLVYPKSFAGAVQTLLGQDNITQVHLPKELAGHTFRDTLLALERRQYTIREELVRIDTELERVAQGWRGKLVTWRRAIKSHLQELATRARFSATTYTFIIVGWVPKRDLARLRETLAREVGDQVIVEELATQDGMRNQVPVAFTNPAPLKPFEMLVRMLAVPRYGAFDPTPVLAVFLPLFFGIILGDVAYGAMALGLALYLRRRFAANETLANLAHVLTYGSVWAIVFGLLYGEFLGTLGSLVGLQPLWMPREGQHMLALFALALGLGVVQVVMGLLLGVWEAWREKQRSDLLTKIGMLIVLSAMFGIVGIVTELLPRTLLTPSMVGLLIGLVLLIVPVGPIGLFLGPLEVLETVGNILSYLRLAAIGLASMYLALVANAMAGLVGNVLVGIILAVLLHALNFALGITSPAIQALRLHYVEFFRQFYQDGGEEYRPFILD